MPQRRAAKKDLKKNIKRREKNLTLAQDIKAAIKKLKKSIESKDITASKEALVSVYKVLDKAVSKKFIHPNKAARKKSRLAQLLNKIQPSKI